MRVCVWVCVQRGNVWILKGQINRSGQTALLLGSWYAAITLHSSECWSQVQQTWYIIFFLPIPDYFTPAEIQAMSHWRLEWAPASFLIVPCLRGCQQPTGRGWTLSPGGWGELGDRTLAVSGAGVKKRDGEGTDKLAVGSQVVGSHSFRWERRELYISRKHPGGIHPPAPALLHLLIHITQPLSARLLTNTSLLEVYAMGIMWPYCSCTTAIEFLAPWLIVVLAYLLQLPRLGDLSWRECFLPF